MGIGIIDGVATAGIVIAVIAAIIVLLVIVTISKSVRIVQQGFEGVVTRFGEFKDIKNPGLCLHLPLHRSDENRRRARDPAHRRPPAGHHARQRGRSS